MTVVVGVCACGVAGGGTHKDAASGGGKAAPLQAPAPAQRPVWMYSVQMVSAAAGWALLSPSNPNGNASLEPARTVDGGRTWTPVPPRPGRTAPLDQAVLEPASASRAWLAAAVGGNPGGMTEVFVTSDGGSSWQESSPIPGSNPTALDFAGYSDGWLIQNLGAAMGQNAIRLYRSTDAGLRWSLLAKTARLPLCW